MEVVAYAYQIVTFFHLWNQKDQDVDVDENVEVLILHKCDIIYEKIIKIKDKKIKISEQILTLFKTNSNIYYLYYIK